MPSMTQAPQTSSLTVEIGGLPIQFRCQDTVFVSLLSERYSGYLVDSAKPRFEFDVELAPPGTESGDEEVSVSWNDGQWLLERGDFRSEWNPASGRGRIQQTINPYSLDSVLRIVHTLLLADQGGFLLHASSAVRNGRAFMFSGVSGAGKTTIARLAPQDVTLLTDEISYVTLSSGAYAAVGTPFYGELARNGDNLRAPVECVYLLAQGPSNKIESLEIADAARGLLRNILFFSKDPQSVKSVFDAAIDFVRRVPVRRLTFVPDSSVWELIR